MSQVVTDHRPTTFTDQDDINNIATVPFLPRFRRHRPLVVRVVMTWPLSEHRILGTRPSGLCTVLYSIDPPLSTFHSTSKTSLGPLGVPS
jgi:hypothetical protein